MATIYKTAESYEVEVGRVCQICDRTFEVFLDESTIFCPECKEKLQKLLGLKEDGEE